MRAVILVLLVLGIAASIDSARAGLTITPRENSVPADNAMSAPDDNDHTAALSGEADLQSEKQLKLSSAKRRDVQRRLTKLGFATKPSGRFNDTTRDAIGRWQEQRGYVRTGFLNAAQHQALLTESATIADGGKPDERRHSAGRARHARGGGIGGPIGAIGHVVSGILGR